ncbi:MAG: hypothetical protein Q9M92_07300 [Enterobacterales bacterium]|nr:hypothetical protein [Enterobacterales bacterium]
MVKLVFTTILIFYSLQSLALERISDPTRPAYMPSTKSKAGKSKQVKRQLLTAIFFTQNNRRAIINDQLYQTGDIFSGKKIISIKENKVLLKSATGTSQLTLIKPIKKMKKQ